MQKKIPKKLVLLITGSIIVILVMVILILSKSDTSNKISDIVSIPIPATIVKSFVKIADAEPVQPAKIATSSTQISDISANTDSVNLGLPISLEIPNINVDASIEYLGLTIDGAMAVPKGPNNVAWFSLGTIPGVVGSAVIAGHFGWKNNIPAVFDDLHKLQIGDKISIKTDKGITVTFIVREIGVYDQNGDATNVFSSNDGKAHLNLITCEGVWNPVLKTRPNRLVVFTDME